MVMLSIVLPAYNEARVIAASLRRLADYLDAPGIAGASGAAWSSWEIVVVDDGSHDGTADAAAAALGEEPRLTVLRMPVNSGKWAAITAGMKAARGEILITTDVDLSYGLSDLGAAASLLAPGSAACDIVTGNRRHAASRMDLALSALGHVLRRQAISVVFNLCVRIVYGVASKDTQCGLKGFSRKAAAEVLPRLRTRRFLADVEVFLIAERLGLRIEMIPVHLTFLSSDSTVHVLGHAPAVIADALRIKEAQVMGRYEAERG